MPRRIASHELRFRIGVSFLVSALTPLTTIWTEGRAQKTTEEVHIDVNDERSILTIIAEYRALNYLDITKQKGFSYIGLEVVLVCTSRAF